MTRELLTLNWEQGRGFGQLYFSLLMLVFFRLLPISFIDTLKIRDLPLHHRDPFDRMLISHYSQRGKLIKKLPLHFILHRERLWYTSMLSYKS